MGDLGAVLLLDALMADPGIQYEQIAFHGGTSLHFSWRSPRLSEDLDFLLARDAGDVHAVVERAAEKVTEAFRAEDPGFTIELKSKTRHDERMIAYELRISNPNFIGKTLVVEFWRVTPEYLPSTLPSTRLPCAHRFNLARWFPGFPIPFPQRH